MIITRSPLRITLGGGGTDLPSYYRDHGGFCISAAIDRYVYVNVHRRFMPGYLLKYSQVENVASVADIHHPVIRECLSHVRDLPDNLEITSMADIPAGTGLGSSGSFTTALLKALHAVTRTSTDARELAEEACHIELDRLGEPIGKQDQYIAAFGGLTCLRFAPDGQVEVSPLAVTEDTLFELQERLLLFFTGYSRAASDILREQHQRSLESDEAMLANLHLVKALGQRSQAALEAGDLEAFAALMHEHWCHKKQRSGGMSNPHIDRWYEVAMANGAQGGKLIGAGGGGFLMFYASDNGRLRKALRAEGLREVRFRFEHEGTKVLSMD